MAGSKNAEGGAGLDPMHQFEVKKLIEKELEGDLTAIENAVIREEKVLFGAKK